MSDFVPFSGTAIQLVSAILEIIDAKGSTDEIMKGLHKRLLRLSAAADSLHACQAHQETKDALLEKLQEIRREINKWVSMPSYKRFLRASPFLGNEGYKDRFNRLKEELETCIADLDLDLIINISKKKNTKDKRLIVRDFMKSSLEIRQEDVQRLDSNAIGHGASAAVYRVQYSGSIMACKVFDLTGHNYSELKKMFQNFDKELQIMSKLRNPNIITIHGIVTSVPEELGIIMDYASHGSLRQVLDKMDKDFQLATLYHWSRDVAYAMNYLHQQNIFHRDLKSLNVLICENFKAKVSDFGASKASELHSTLANSTTTATTRRNSNDHVGTAAWMAPEYILNNEFTVKSDVYAYAIVMWEILTGEIPWKGLSQVQIISKVTQQHERPSLDGISEDAQLLVDLMIQCWVP